MQPVNFRIRVVSLAIAMVVVSCGAGLSYYWSVEQSRADVVDASKRAAEAGLRSITESLAPTLDSLVRAGFFRDLALTRNEEKRADTVLAIRTANALRNLRGMEGGLYFTQFDQFFGYAFPSSPPPLPVYGPPPRSYNIIREQILRTITTDKTLVEMHQFDPATFPLVTEPLSVRGKPVGAVWARIHIERIIPTISLTTVFLVAAVVLLAGLTIAMFFVWNVRRRVEEIRSGLLTLHDDSAYRFPSRTGVIGFIAHSINEMVEARSTDQRRRTELENEIHQQDKLASLGKLIARVAHEVKTPLAIIKTRVQMWERKFDRTSAVDAADGILTRESMELVLNEIDRLSELVKRLLVFSKPAVDRRQMTSLNDLMDHVLSLTSDELRDRGIRVERRYTTGLPQVMIDFQALEQVLINILTNAWEAMPGGGKLIITTARDESANALRLSVLDSGPGISPEIRSRIFDPFFTTKEQGVGLGLSISYEIVRAHGGRLVFGDRQEEGAECIILLPINRVNGHHS